MTKSGINLESVKIKNRQAILKLLNDHGAMSRKDIAAYVRLTSASVTQLCTEMMDEDLIVEIGEVSELGKVGRKKILVDINYNSFSICSITIEKYTSTVTITNLKGKIIDQHTEMTNSQISPVAFLEILAQHCLTMLKDHHIRMEKMLGLGVSVRGIVDKPNGVSVHAYDIWEEKVPIREILTSHIPCNVIVENNMKAFAQGEIIYGLGKRYSKLLFLKWYPGVGSAIVIDGEVYHGNDNKVAELGHYIIDPRGKRCKCGRMGCLETVAAFYSIVDQITLVCNATNTPLLFEKTKGNRQEIHNYLLAYVEGETNEMDAAVEEIFGTVADRVARSMVNIITMLSPDKIVIFGQMFENQGIKHRFLDACYKYDRNYTDEYVLKSELSDKFSYIGGTAVVANELFFNVGGKLV